MATPGNRCIIRMGDIINNKTILKLPCENNGLYFVECKCGNIYNATLSQLKSSQKCIKCAHGFYKGKIIDGFEFLDRVDGKWKIKCTCGNIFFRRSKHFNKDKTFIGCGCSTTLTYLSEAKEKIGLKFGKLKVIAVRQAHRHNILVCKCKCGNIIEFDNGHEYKRNSCGCLKKDNATRAEKKGNARFKNVEITSMRDLYDSKLYTLEEICTMFNINANYLSRIVNRFIWKSI